MPSKEELLAKAKKPAEDAMKRTVTGAVQKAGAFLQDAAEEVKAAAQKAAKSPAAASAAQKAQKMSADAGAAAQKAVKEVKAAAQKAALP